MSARVSGQELRLETRDFGEKKRIRPKVFSALKTQVPRQAKKEVWCIPKKLVFREKKGKNHIPSDTKLLLTKNYSEIIIFGKLRISYVIP